MTAFTATGRWRVYFNRHGAAGLPWCVAPDDGGWELAVTALEVEEPTTAVYQPKAVPDDEDGRPSAWFVTWGLLEVTADGRACISHPDR